MMQGVIFDAFGDQRKDRAFMTEWFKGRNQKVIDALPREKLLVYSPSEGWEPLCSFLGVPLPAEPFPRINRRDELRTQLEGGIPPDPEAAERSARDYIEKLKSRAFRS